MNILYDHQIFNQQQYSGVFRFFYKIANRIADLLRNKVEIFDQLYVNEYFRDEYKVHPRGIKILPLRVLLNIICDINRKMSCFLVRSRHDVQIVDGQTAFSKKYNNWFMTEVLQPLTSRIEISCEVRQLCSQC